MDYDFSKLESLCDSVNGRPITKIVIELATDELIKAIRGKINE